MTTTPAEQLALRNIARAEALLSPATAEGAMKLACTNASLVPLSSARLACRAGEHCAPTVEQASEALQLVRRLIGQRFDPSAEIAAVRVKLGDACIDGFSRLRHLAARQASSSESLPLNPSRRAVRLAACILVFALMGLRSGFAQTEASGWSLTREGDEQAVLSSPRGARVRFAGITPQTRMECLPSPGGQAAAIVLHYPRYSSVMMYRLEEGGAAMREITVPLLPGGSILKEFPRAGKPAGVRLRLDAMGIDRSGWADSARLALKAHLYLVDEATGDTSWFYDVDYVLTLPAAADPAEASQQVVNVVLRHDGSKKDK